MSFVVGYGWSKVFRQINSELSSSKPTSWTWNTPKLSPINICVFRSNVKHIRPLVSDWSPDTALHLTAESRTIRERGHLVQSSHCSDEETQTRRGWVTVNTAKPGRGRDKNWMRVFCLQLLHSWPSTTEPHYLCSGSHLPPHLRDLTTRGFSYPNDLKCCGYSVPRARNIKHPACSPTTEWLSPKKLSVQTDHHPLSLASNVFTYKGVSNQHSRAQTTLTGQKKKKGAGGTTDEKASWFWLLFLSQFWANVDFHSLPSNSIWINGKCHSVYICLWTSTNWNTEWEIFGKAP